MSTEDLKLTTNETFVHASEQPIYDIALLVLAQNGFNLDSSFREATTDRYSIIFGDLYLTTAGTTQSTEIFSKLQQEPEFRVLKHTFTRTEHANLPGAVYRQEPHFEDRPVEFFRLLMACQWDEEARRQVTSRFWENEAENWRYAAQQSRSFARAVFMAEVGVVFEEHEEEHEYNLLQKIGIASLSAIISPYGLMGLAAEAFMRKEYLQSAEVCTQTAKLIRSPFDRLTDEEIPDLLTPPISRISARLGVES